MVSVIPKSRAVKEIFSIFIVTTQYLPCPTCLGVNYLSYSMEESFLFRLWIKSTNITDKYFFSFLIFQTGVLLDCIKVV